MYARDDRVRLPIYIYRIRIGITIQYCSNPQNIWQIRFQIPGLSFWGCYIHIWLRVKTLLSWCSSLLNMRYPKVWSLISFPTLINMSVASTMFRHMKHRRLAVSYIQKQSPPNHVDNCFDAWRPHCFIILNIHFPWLAGLQLIYSWFLFSNSKPLVYQRVNVNFPICFHHFPAFSHSSLALCDLRLFGRLLRALRHSRRRHRRHCRHRHWGPAVWFRWSLLMIIAKNPCLANNNSWTKPWSTVHWCLFMLC